MTRLGFTTHPGLPPGPPLPAAAQTLAYLARPVDFIVGCHRRYGDCFTVDTVLFGVEVVVVQPEVIKQVFTGDPDVYRAGEANAALEPIVGRRSVLLLDGKEHLRHRRLLMPPFHGERMLAYASTMREVTEAAIARLPVGRPFTLHGVMQGITLDIILRTVFGVDEGEALAALRDALPRVLDRMGNPVAALALAPMFQRSLYGLSPWDAFVRDMKRADDLVLAQIDRRRRDASRGPRTDVLAMLLEARDEDGRPLTDQELRDELMTLLVAGHETTATMLCWAFDFILSDGRVRARLLDEIGKGDDPAAAAGIEYLDATIKEALRLRPVIPAVARKLSAPMDVAGHRLPAGTLLVPELYLTHRLPDVYPDPERFFPERFVDKKPDLYAWLPFGGGIRRCLGMAFAMYELKIVLATVLSRVRLHKVDPARARVALRGFTLVPGGGAEVVVDSIAPPAQRPAPVTMLRDAISTT
jgi:cytochrome P450